MPHSTGTHTATIDGQQVNVASLETIDLGRLEANEPAEVEKLLNASQMPGFFYLNFGDYMTKKFLEDLPTIYAAAEEYFDKPEDEKKNDIRDGQDRGYTSRGSMEAYEIPRDETLKRKFNLLPNPFRDLSDTLGNLSFLCHDVNMIILSRLSDALKLSGSDRFEEKQRKGKPTNTGLKLLSDPTKEKVADCVDNTHTDSGTLTVVFSDEWSTQIEHPETKVWAFCEPKKGLPLINVADSLQAHSGGKLHSCRHRVTQPVDGVKKRYFVAYFMRPEIAT